MSIMENYDDDYNMNVFQENGDRKSVFNHHFCSIFEYFDSRLTNKGKSYQSSDQYVRNVSSYAIDCMLNIDCKCNS